MIREIQSSEINIEDISFEERRSNDIIKKKLKDEFRDKIIKSIIDEVRSELEQEIRKELKEEIRKEIRNQIRKELNNEIEIRKELNNEIKSECDVVNNIYDGTYISHIENNLRNILHNYIRNPYIEYRFVSKIKVNDVRNYKKHINFQQRKTFELYKDLYSTTNFNDNPLIKKYDIEIIKKLLHYENITISIFSKNQFYTFIITNKIISYFTHSINYNVVTSHYKVIRNYYEGNLNVNTNLLVLNYPIVYKKLLSIKVIKKLYVYVLINMYKNFKFVKLPYNELKKLILVSEIKNHIEISLNIPKPIY